MERLLRDAFTWRRRLLTWGDEVDSLAYPLYWPMAHSRPPRGQGLVARRHPVLSW
jgi:hypothetical protein